jgi:hypothetical protein
VNFLAHCSNGLADPGDRAFSFRAVTREESAMRKILFGLLALGAATMATPARAQVYFEVDAGPVAARIGPPPPWRWHRRHWAPRYAYAYVPCRIIRERIRRPNGRWIYRERQICG